MENDKLKKEIADINSKYGREMMGGVLFISVIMFFSNFYFKEPLLNYFSIAGITLFFLSEAVADYEIKQARKKSISE